MNGINDLRSYSRVWVRNFILSYKKEACLWQTAHPDYNNSIIRNESYDKLVNKLKEVENDPDRIMVVKKVNSLRSAFRREYRKKVANKNYVPKLWYFDILSFIAEQSPGKKIKNGRKSKLLKTESIDQARNMCVEEVLIDENINIDHLPESEQEIDENLMEQEQELGLNIKQELKQQMRVLKISNIETQDTELREAVNTIEDHQSISRTAPYQEQQEQHQQEIEETQHPQTAITHSIQSIQLSKEQLHAILNPTNNTSTTAVTGNYISKDEFDAIGINVASKLRCMNPTQRIIAEKLISDVLFNGQLDILSISSKIIST